MSLVGTVLRDRYEIINEHSKGGMSTIYLARDKNFDSKYWAVKRVKNITGIEISAFKKEVELLSSLDNSDIPQIIDRIQAGDDYFVVMDFINGVSLEKKVTNEGPLPEKDVIEWARKLCDILLYLHTAKENPIIYRDMKPANVMLTDTGRLKLIDFGIAKECRRDAPQYDTVGTKGYAAPEQYKGASNILDERTDIYGFGATLFFLVTGQIPKKPPNAIPPVRQLNQDLSEGIEYIINKCTQDNPENRYDNCRQIMDDLDNIDQLTTGYRDVIKRRIMLFCVSILLSIAFFLVGIIGYIGVQNDKENAFQTAKNTALYYELSGDYHNAAEQWRIAIENKPTDVDSYLKLFNSMLPKNDSTDHINETKKAIDAMRAYVDNINSPVHNNTDILYELIVRCLDSRFTEDIYAQYAAEYIQIIRQTERYTTDNRFSLIIDSYAVIAMFLSTDLSRMNFSTLSNALQELEYNTINDDGHLTSDEKLNTLYSLIGIYGRYPHNLPNAYNNINRIGRIAKEIIDANAYSENLAFNSIIPMYEIIATCLYDGGISTSDISQKRNMLYESLEWFSFLDDINADLSESALMKRGNTHRAIFDTYIGISIDEHITDNVNYHIEQALIVYSGILNRNPYNFTAQVNITMVYISRELIKPLSDRDFTSAIEGYNRVLDLKNENRNLSTAQLSQFSALRQQMVNAGLDG